MELALDLSEELVFVNGSVELAEGLLALIIPDPGRTVAVGFIDLVVVRKTRALFFFLKVDVLLDQYPRA